MHEDNVLFVVHEVGVGFSCFDRVLHAKPAAEGLHEHTNAHQPTASMRGTILTKSPLILGQKTGILAAVQAEF